jgi:hypothetical protein
VLLKAALGTGEQDTLGRARVYGTCRSRGDGAREVAGGAVAS